MEIEKEPKFLKNGDGGVIEMKRLFPNILHSAVLLSETCVKLWLLESSWM